jgi:cyclic beta-1,2-glucan synthetase
MEQVLGLQIRGDRLLLVPCIPKAWRSYRMSYQYIRTRYEITVENPNGLSHGIAAVELDGAYQPGSNSIMLQNDGQLHQVRVVMGP